MVFYLFGDSLSSLHVYMIVCVYFIHIGIGYIIWTIYIYIYIVIYIYTLCRHIISRIIPVGVLIQRDTDVNGVLERFCLLNFREITHLQHSSNPHPWDCWICFPSFSWVKPPMVSWQNRRQFSIGFCGKPSLKACEVQVPAGFSIAMFD